MTHFAHLLTINRLGMMPHLGFYDEERGKRQKIEISLRLYFPEAPACCADDHARFLDYGALSTALRKWAEASEFRLIEFMGKQAFQFVREYMDTHGAAEAKLWLQLTKCQTPVPDLHGGASFIHSDLPPGATTVYTPVL